MQLLIEIIRAGSRIFVFVRAGGMKNVFVRAGGSAKASNVSNIHVGEGGRSVFVGGRRVEGTRSRRALLLPR